MQHAMQREQMGPVHVNEGVHTARKQHQRKNVPICVRVASRVLCGLGLRPVRVSVSTMLLQGVNVVFDVKVGQTPMNS